MRMTSWKARGSREGVADDRRTLLGHMATLHSLPEVQSGKPRRLGQRESDGLADHL